MGGGVGVALEHLNFHAISLATQTVTYFQHPHDQITTIIKPINHETVNNMQTFIPATILVGEGRNLSYGEDDLRRVWGPSDARQRHITLLTQGSYGYSLEKAAKQTEVDFEQWMYNFGNRGVTPEIDIEVFERFYDEIFRNIMTAKADSEYKLTRKEPGGMLVQIDSDGNPLLQTIERGVNP